ncbi:MAG: GntR family transcriptional regulator [Christensenellales bacterium]|jgi:DNA-binding GntR family transcriptional regulator
MRRGDAVSARAWVYKTLKAGILRGEYPAGFSMVEVRIAKELATSRTPVREAMRDLAQEGLLDYFPNRGMFVRPIFAQEIRDAFTVRIILEEQAVRWACQRMTEKNKEEFNHIITEMESLIRKNDADPKNSVVEVQFHDVIHKATGSAILANTLESLDNFILRARNISMKYQARAAEVLSEHLGIAQAIVKGDEELAATLMKEHIRHAMKQVLIAIEEENTNTHQL